ncbi:uncharacterized protein LOC116211624 [Punica granatum]|uniref:Uncharacterized protein n=2 Tax=Punica granatum TaxID=22663 RepID=A0A218WTD4_PUNGR|nr:uncharacterized protein LOC116211624 [Punica granatum]OWM75769.1 hypothetical protein CDL15_Pgr009413 [Punica granatum]PKI60457.1 hypothetical protein CRG98_019111 [Punica granatum]
MNHCVIQQNAFLAREEMRREAMVCPKPRRLGSLTAAISDHPTKPLRWHLSNQAELCDSKAGADVLDIILSKGGGYGAEQPCAQIASSPPFFCGSPPSRVSNPLIKDDRFGDEKVLPFSPLSPIAGPPSGLSSSPSSSSRKGGCVRANFGSKPAVRIEGFDCLNRDRRNCGIPALA